VRTCSHVALEERTLTVYHSFENNFVRNLLIHLKPDEIDPDYKPAHGMGAKAVSRKP
jgi:hypothetical protein